MTKNVPSTGINVHKEGWSMFWSNKIKEIKRNEKPIADPSSEIILDPKAFFSFNRIAAYIPIISSHAREIIR